MINELYGLSEAMEQAGVQKQEQHRKYKPLPNITEKAPCVRILISDGNVIALSEVERELGKKLCKFGSNQGTFPCMNLAPLYRVADQDIKEQISRLTPEAINEECLEKIRSWCTNNNWGGKLRNKFKISMKNVPEELLSMQVDYEPLKILIEESSRFLDPDYFHQQLENEAFRMLERKEKVSLALCVLFHLGDSQKAPENDAGAISVALESQRLIDMGTPAVSVKFTDELNRALLRADAPPKDTQKLDLIDAFGIPFALVEEPMPSVKLAGGFEATIRTMFEGQPCQERYGKIGSASYPASPQIRKDLQGALNWLGNEEHREVTWINTDKNEILFAYPDSISQMPSSMTRMFKRPQKNQTAIFETQAGQLIKELKQSRKPDTDPHAEHIQIFILRKIDKARTKVVYTRLTDAAELEACSEAWTKGCLDNLPAFYFGKPYVPYPLDAADILNRFWKQNGEAAVEDFKPIPKYHGMELLLEPDTPVQRDLHLLSEQAMALGCYAGRALAVKRKGDSLDAVFKSIKPMLALMGLLLHRSHIRKEDYMEHFPYLLGQLLKVSDELHVMYCKVVRSGDIPPQLAGGSLYQSAAEAPMRTLSLLGQRMSPYIVWAKSYRRKKINDPNDPEICSWRAGWLLSVYEQIAKQLQAVWTETTRFNDEEKAQLFIGYLAVLPKSESKQDDGAVSQITQNEEEFKHE